MKVIDQILLHQLQKQMRGSVKPDIVETAGLYDIAYAQDEDPLHQLDVYFPNPHGSYPLVFNIHGGAWVAGDKEQNRRYSKYIAHDGFCVVNMSYRLLPQTNLQGQIQDIMQAVRKIETMQKQLPWDGQHVVLMGDSAGAHLAGLLYCILQDEDLQKRYACGTSAFNIHALVLQNTVSDLSYFSDHKKYIYKAMARQLLGKHIKASPFYHCASFLETIQEDMRKTAVFLVSSEHDPLHLQTVNLIAYLKSHDWDYQTCIWKKEEKDTLGHVFQVKHPEWEESKITHQQMINFLKKQCAKPLCKEKETYENTVSNNEMGTASL